MDYRKNTLKNRIQDMDSSRVVEKFYRDTYAGYRTLKDDRFSVNKYFYEESPVTDRIEMDERAARVMDKGKIGKFLSKTLSKDILAVCQFRFEWNPDRRVRAGRIEEQTVCINIAALTDKAFRETATKEDFDAKFTELLLDTIYEKSREVAERVNELMEPLSERENTGDGRIREYLLQFKELINHEEVRNMETEEEFEI